MRDRYVLKLKTQFETEELAQKLREYEPWSIRIDFDNGVSTKDFKHRTPFSENTLQKLSIVAQHIPFEELRGGDLLDIGCNSGYNSIFAATQYGMSPVGIDYSPRHIKVSNFLAHIAGIQGEFILNSAEAFSRPDSFDVVLHFGTLYHLRNPILSLEKTYENLRPNGYLAIETQIYEHPDDENMCYFMHMQNNDPTNYWALSPTVLKKFLALIGFHEIEMILKVKPKMLEKYMARMVLVARKPK